MHPNEYAAATTPDDRFLPTALRCCFNAWGMPADVARPLVADLAKRYDPAPYLPATQTVADGDRLPIPGRAIRVIHTPGHTTGHACLLDEEHDVLFAGDLVLPGITPGVGLGAASPTNPLTDIIGSLDRVASLSALCLPGHGEPIPDIGIRCAEILSRYEARTAQEHQLLERYPRASLWEIATSLSWSGSAWKSLMPYLRRSAISQVAMHAARVRGNVPDDRSWQWA
jgi:glyoxylase-like metal-dependent hydrolase (beta-lactamase superfamily II)